MILLGLCIYWQWLHQLTVYLGLNGIDNQYKTITQITKLVHNNYMLLKVYDRSISVHNIIIVQSMFYQVGVGRDLVTRGKSWSVCFCQLETSLETEHHTSPCLGSAMMHFLSTFSCCAYIIWKTK